MRHRLRTSFPALVGLLAAMACGLGSGPPSASAASGAAQPPAPAEETGFTTLFDGTATGTPHSLDKWLQAGAGSLELQSDGSLKTVGGLGMLWFPGQEFGDMVFRVDYKDPAPVDEATNGGVFVRFPDLRVPLAGRPAGYTYAWPGASGPFPPAQTYASDPASADSGNRTYCGRTGAANGDNANAMAWFAIFCGEEIQVLDGTNGDAIKTGSVYNFANLDATGARVTERAKNQWHTMEIRLVGQQYTILVDGQVLNQYDNAIPLRSGRGGDPPSTSRQFATGFVGLQNHEDGLFFRNPRVKDLAAPPHNTERPTVGGSGRVGAPLTCTKGEWNNAKTFTMAWFRSNPSPTVPPGTSPTAAQLGTVKVADSMHYRPSADDVGKVVWCQVTATNAEGGTAWATSRAPEVIAQR
jgi:3-keto-disaccharide hydrolase